VSDEGLLRSPASTAVPRSRRLPGHALLARGSRPTSWSERRDDHLLPGEGRTRSPAAAAQVGAGLSSRQNEAQGKPKTGQLCLDYSTLVVYGVTFVAVLVFVSLQFLPVSFWKQLKQLTDLKLSDFFVLRNDARSRGHPYRLFLPGCSSAACTRHNCFAHRVARTWNNLPEDSTHFSSLALFKRSLNSNILVRHCKIYYF